MSKGRYVELNLKEIAEIIRGSALANGGADNQEMYEGTIEENLDALSTDRGAAERGIRRALSRKEILVMRDILFG